VARIEIQVLDKDRLYNLFSFLNLEEQCFVAINIVDDLATQVVGKVVEKFLVLLFLTQIDAFDLKPTIVLTFLVSLGSCPFFVLLVIFARLG